MAPTPYTIIDLELTLVQRRLRCALMTSDSWRERTELIRWPDEDAGPYLVSVGWRLLGERWECVALAVTIAEEARAARPAHGRPARPAPAGDRGQGGRRAARGACRRNVEQLRASQARPSSRAEYREMLLERRRADEALRAAAAPQAGPAAGLRQRAAARLTHLRRGLPRPPAADPGGGRGPRAQLRRRRPSASPAARAAGFLGPAEQGKASLGGYSWGGVMPPVWQARSPSMRSANAAVVTMPRGRGSRDADPVPTRADMVADRSAAKAVKTATVGARKGPFYFRKSASIGLLAGEETAAQARFCGRDEARFSEVNCNIRACAGPRD